MERVAAQDRDQWDGIAKMLKHLRGTQGSNALFEEEIRRSIADMQLAGMLHHLHRLSTMLTYV